MEYTFDMERIDLDAGDIATITGFEARTRGSMVTLIGEFTTQQAGVAADAVRNAPDASVSKAIQAAGARLFTEATAFIDANFDEGAKYAMLKRHTKLTRKEGKGALAQAEEQHVADIETVDAWSVQVMIYAYAKLDVLTACQTVAAVAAVTWDFEGLFGVAGTQLAKPNVNVRNFLTTE